MITMITIIKTNNDNSKTKPINTIHHKPQTKQKHKHKQNTILIIIYIFFFD